MQITHANISKKLTSCKTLRKRINCFLKSSKSSSITLRIDSFSTLILSSSEPFESRVNCGEGRFDEVRLWKLSKDRGLSEPALLCWNRERFRRRVARAGRCDLQVENNLLFSAVRQRFFFLILIMTCWWNLMEYWHYAYQGREN